MLVGLALGGLALGAPSPPLATIARSPASDLVIGEFPLVRVVDGDTVRVKGLDSSLRLLGIDTEETFKHDKERRAYTKGFAAYAKDVRGASPRPAKFATPLGDEAKRWAEAWFKDVTTVRLEREAWWTARGDFVAKFHDEAARGAQPSAGAQHDSGPLHGGDSQQTGNSPRSTGSPRGTGSEPGTGSQHGSGAQRAVMVDLPHDDAVALLAA